MRYNFSVVDEMSQPDNVVVLGSFSEPGPAWLSLHQAVARHAPIEDIAAIGKANPAAASEVDEDGNTPLHAACALCWPNPQVQAGAASALLALFPAAATRHNKGGLTPLHLACRLPLGLPTILALLKACPQAAEIASSNKSWPCWGCLPLHSLCCHSSVTVDAISAILKAFPAASWTVDARGRHPLHHAAQQGACNAVIQRLLKANPASASVRDIDRRRPLHFAAEGTAPLDVVESLLAADPTGVRSTGFNGSLALHIASAYAPPAVISLLASAYPAALLVNDSEGATPLIRACTRFPANAEAITALLAAQSGATAASIANAAGALPLHLVARNPALDSAMLPLLAAFKGAAEAKNGQGKLPLHCMMDGGASIDAVLLLLGAHIAALRAMDSIGRLPLHAAATRQARPDVVTLLLALYPNAASHRDSRGRLPLHAAAMLYSTESAAAQESIIRRLLHLHEEAVAVVAEEELPLHIAARSDAGASIINMLISVYPQGTAARGKNGNTPLHCAAEAGASLQAAMALLGAHSAAAASQNKDGRTPLHLAVSLQKPPIGVVSLLLLANPAATATSDHALNLPLHLAASTFGPSQDTRHLVTKSTFVTSLIAEYPAAASKQNAAGHLPLHQAAMAGAPLPVLSALMAAHPGGLSQADSKGRLPLYFAAANGADKDEFSALLSANPAAASVRGGKHGLLPLHATLTKDLDSSPPRHIIDALVAAFPEAVRECDSKGRTMLHLAARSNTDNVKLVLGMDLTATLCGVKSQDGNTPLHELMLKQFPGSSGALALIAAYPAAVLILNNMGKSPLHLAIQIELPDFAVVTRRECLAGVAEAMIKACPAAAALANSGGALPLHIAIAAGVVPEYRDNTLLLQLLAAHPQAAAVCVGGDAGLFPLHVLMGEVGVPAAVKLAVLEAHPAAAAAANQATGELPLHAAARGFDVSCDKFNHASVLQAVLTAFPDGVMHAATDGNLPLHVAAAAGTHSALSLLLPLLAAAAPITASVPNHVSGMLALHVLAEVAGACDDYDLEAAVGALLEAAPSSAAQRDRRGKLPLHRWAVAFPSNCESLLAFEAVLRAHQAGARERDNAGRTPLECALLAEESAPSPWLQAALLLAAPETAAAALALVGIPAGRSVVRLEAVSAHARPRAFARRLPAVRAWALAREPGVVAKGTSVSSCCSASFCDGPAAAVASAGHFDDEEGDDGAAEAALRAGSDGGSGSIKRRRIAGEYSGPGSGNGEVCQ